MLSIIGAILGLLGSALPEWLKLKKEAQDHAHELRMFELQIQLASKQAEFKMQEMGMEADIRESEALYKSAETKLTGWVWVDGIIALYNSSVRPTVAYAFMGLYAYVKYSVIYTAVKGGANWQTLGPMIWSSEDFAVFTTIIGFFYGARGMRYAMDKIGTRANIPGAGIVRIQ